MAKAPRRGGLYRNAGGSGFHDSEGDPVALADVPPELLTDEELKELGAVDLLAKPDPKPTPRPGPKAAAKATTEPEPKVAGTITPNTSSDETQAGTTNAPPPPPPTELPEDFPGREQLVAAGLKTTADVFAHPNIEDVKGIGPKTAKAILELKPKSPEA